MFFSAFADHEQFYKCDKNTPQISLENKVPYVDAKFQGPFFNVPRDNQNGLGTCYANVAKNLLIGISKGKDKASYLDLALTYKKNRTASGLGLGGGYSCEALQAIQQEGFCPSALSPLENGKKNLFSQGLLGGVEANVAQQDKTIEYLQKFFQGQEIMKEGSPTLSNSMLGQAKVIIFNLTTHEHLKLPLPIARVQIPSDEELLELFHKNYLNSDDFMTDYRAEYRKFYPDYLKLVMKGEPREKMFLTFTKKMANFINKYKASHELVAWRSTFLSSTEKDANDPFLKESVRESAEFLKLMSGLQGKSHEAFFRYSEKSAGDSIQFISSLKPLVTHLQNLHVDPQVLMDDNGRFKSVENLMQLAVAPACLSLKNRPKPSYPFVCDNGRETVAEIKNMDRPLEAKLGAMRKRIVESLLEGYPLGNTFPGHTNTIVGMRFNPAAQNCEYQIRESQDGKSHWQPEKEIFLKMTGLTEARRAPQLVESLK